MSISKELRDAIDRIDRTRGGLKVDMNFYIDDWCKELGWSDDSSIADHAREVQSEIRRHLKTSLNQLFFRRKKRLVGRKGKPNSKTASGSEVLTDIEEKMTPEARILLALMLVGAGYASYKLQQMHKQKQISTHSPLRDQLPVQPILWKLILVINVKHQNLLKRMEEKGLSLVNQDELMEATQYLWLGREQELKANTELTYWLNGDVVRESNSSEYDVHLVEMELPRNITELQPKVSFIDRRDAFDQVVKDGKVIRVTPRLPSEAFANTGVYEL